MLKNIQMLKTTTHKMKALGDVFLVGSLALW